MIEGLVVGGIVLAAGLFVGVRAWKTLRGKSCGCSGGKGPCPAATSIAVDIQRAAVREGRAPGND